jgi:peptidoglycan hydrolase-like protein with peptidoglycan-binding domain
MFQDNGIFGGFQTFQGFGAFGAASLTTGAGCGDLKQTQQVLDELGYSVVGKADGIFGPNTQKALSAFAKDHGFSYDGKSPSGQMCEALQMAWNAAHPGTAPLSPPAGGGGIASKLNLLPILKTMIAQKNAQDAAAQQAAAAQAAANAGPLSKVKAWWGGQSTMVKVGIGGGALVLVGLGVVAATSKPKSYAANRRRRRSRG